MAETVSVKVVRLETQMAEVSAQITEVKGLVKELIVKVDAFNDIQTQVALLKEEIDELKKRSARSQFLIPTISAAAGAILTVLIISYISHGGK